MEKPAGLDAHFARRARATQWKPTAPDGLTEREYLLQFAARPGMFIGFTTVRGVTCFLNGYDYAARRTGGRGLDGFREWLLANHLRRESSLCWSGLVTQIALPARDDETDLSPEQELRVVEVLFDLLDQFLAERADVV
ncbi:hypothetical protein [Nocardia rosealba]|uniref:hypothetical protein n=1 Tax=Nocardia rosealba TaxID=2878563 RepID=UPI001CDA1122|nr:hypothetical protein [Nocardia rosealba]MCA2208793.1 hypothetical protein [Nocardia rosealba]